MSYPVRHWFLPHPANNHKAKLLHPSGLALILCLILTIQIGFHLLHRYTPNILGVATDIRVEELLRLTNDERRKAGLSQLKLDPTLSEAATAKAQYMFEHNYWAHTAPDGTNPWDFFKKSGYSYLHAGENLAKEFDRSDGVVSAWMASPSHRANMIRPEYEDIGFAVVNGKLLGEDTTLVVQLFGTRQSGAVANRPIEIGPTLSPLLPASVAVGGMQTARKNWFPLAKGSSLLLGFILMLLLLIDGFTLWRMKAVRLSSHNIAHIFFIASLIGAIYFTGIGIVL